MYYEIRRWLRGYILGWCIFGGEFMDVWLFIIIGSYLGDLLGWWLKLLGKLWLWFFFVNKIKYMWIYVRNLCWCICLL